MAAKRWHGDDDHQGDDDWHHGGDDNDDHGHHGKGDVDFDFELPDIFKIDLSDFNLKKLGKVTDYDVSDTHLSVTFGNVWTFAVDGSDLDVSIKSSSKIPVVTGGTIDSFSIDGPGKADFTISDLDLSAKAFSKALASLDFGKLLDLVLGGDETISGSGYGDYLYGGKGNDTIYGNKGADYLIGGAGDDAIIGGVGNDYLVGGKGADTFLFAPKSGTDLVADFDAGQDVLDLSGYGFGGNVQDFLNQHVQDGHGGRCHGGDDDGVVIDLGGGNMVKLDGVSRLDLTDSNVLL